MGRLPGEQYVELSVHYSEDDKVIEAGERAELLYVRGLTYVQRLLTDGRITDGQLSRFGLSGVKARAARLVEVGLWRRVEGGYVVAAWLKRNKTRRQVEEQYEEKRREGEKGAHRRWHRNRKEPDCEWCYPSPVDRPPNGQPNGQPIGGGDATTSASPTASASASLSGPVQADLTDTVIHYHRQTGIIARRNSLRWLNRLDDEHGAEAVQAAIDAEVTADPDPRSLLGRIEARLTAHRVTGAPKRQRRNDYDALGRGSA